MLNNKPLIFKDLENDLLFDFEKKQVIKLIDKDIDENRDVAVLKKLRILISEIQRLGSKQSFLEITYFSIDNAFSFDEKTSDEILFFIYARGV